MSYRRPYEREDERPYKHARADRAADATSHRSTGGGAHAGSSSYGQDRWTPGGPTNSGPHPSAPSSSARPLATSGFIHPDRANPNGFNGNSNNNSQSHQPPTTNNYNSSNYANHATTNSYRPQSQHSYQSHSHSHGSYGVAGGRASAYSSSHPQPPAGPPTHAATTNQKNNPHTRTQPALAHASSKPVSSSSSSSSSSSLSGPSKADLLEAERLAEEAFQKRMAEKMMELEAEEKSEEELAKEREAKRKAILAKYKVQAELPPAQVLSEQAKEKILEAAGAIEAVDIAPVVQESPTDSAPASDVKTSADCTPAPIAVAEPTVALTANDNANVVEPAAAAAPVETTTTAAPVAPAPAPPSKSLAAAIDEYDMFTDDALAPEVEAGLDGQRDLGFGVGVGDSDAYDDHEGYYRYRLGDLLEGGHYRVTGLQGSGVFSTVLRVRELIPGQNGAPSTEGRELVVKLIRSNETMYNAGQKELELLKLLAAQDPDNKKHVIKLQASFMHRNHLCLVFEPMSMDLRKVIKKFGSVGLNLRAVRSYAKQLMIALRHLKKCMILHGDIKPDNILVNDEMNILKIADLGSAGKLSEACEITPYLVSRFYRAPEIMCGLKYDQQVDLWSVGCCLFELYTGKILFAGSDNNSMLKAIQDVKGRFPKRMIQRGQFTSQHFDLEFNFEWKKMDSVTKQEMRQKMKYDKPTKDLYHMLRSMNETALKASEVVKLKQLADFIHQCLTLDPQQRPQCEQMLLHEFIALE